jgi:hypothetical protein
MRCLDGKFSSEWALDSRLSPRSLSCFVHGSAARTGSDQPHTNVQMPMICLARHANKLHAGTATRMKLWFILLHNINGCRRTQAA